VRSGARAVRCSEGFATRSSAERGVTRAPAATAVAIALAVYCGYLSGANGSVAPFLAASFALDDTEVARLFAAFGLSSAVAVALGRMADRLGRRRLIAFCLAGLPCSALASALAPNAAAFAAAQVVAQSLGAALFATTTVLLVEELAPAHRARGLARAGAAFAAATAVPLVLATLLAHEPGAWRVVYALAALPLLALPFARARIPETALWRDAAARGRTRGACMRELFAPPHLAATLRLVAAAALVHAVEGVTRTFLLYHAVRGQQLAPSRATALLVLAGGAGLVGFPLGARLADRIGRRATFAAGGALVVLCAGLYYGRAPGVPGAQLLASALGIFGLSLGGNAALTAFRALATEFLPTELRASLAGVLSLGGACGWFGAMLAVRALAAPLGGIGPGVALLAVVALPAAAVLVAGVPERGPQEDGHAGLADALRSPALEQL